jgi:DnaJ like chaperone protein
MAKFAKWVGLGLGWAVGGPIGGILGLALGSMFDDNSTTIGAHRRLYQNTTRRGDYAASLLVLVSAVMKADGRVMKSELDYVKNYFYTRFGQDTAQEALVMLKDILKQEVPIREVTSQLNQRLDYAYRLEMIHFLYGIAAADSGISELEKNLIRKIASYMNITSSDIDSIQAMFINAIDADYTILEVDPAASDEEVKKAYRRMAMKYHPDKVSHLGDDFKQVAQEKFRKVKDAYERIKKQRGIT